MRLTINLKDDLYRVAKSLAVMEECSISAAVNRLIRRHLENLAPSGAPPRKQPSDFPVSRGSRRFTSADVRQSELESD